LFDAIGRDRVRIKDLLHPNFSQKSKKLTIFSFIYLIKDFCHTVKDILLSIFMHTSEKSQSILQAGKTTTQEALQLYDSLEPVNCDFMWGRWQGAGLHTDHPMDGLLELSNWYGKEFLDPENVHPLLFSGNKGEIFKVAPHPTLMNWVLKLPIPRNTAFTPLLMFTNSLLKTEKSQARLRMMEYRGVISATMIYDYLPINDSFKKVDDNTVFGIMDFKNSCQPFFFILKREVT
jgi:hypothetical protein